MFTFIFLYFTFILRSFTFFYQVRTLMFITLSFYTNQSFNQSINIECPSKTAMTTVLYAIQCNLVHKQIIFFLIKNKSKTELFVIRRNENCFCLKTQDQVRNIVWEYIGLGCFSFYGSWAH